MALDSHARTAAQEVGDMKGELQDLKRFDAWREKRFWRKRATDEATGGSPPLKHMYQNVFAMTLAGVSLLNRLEVSGYKVVLVSPISGPQTAFETYSSWVAKRIGFRGSYKTDSIRCLEHSVEYLSNQDIGLEFDPDVRKFCETYRTGPKRDDPDGADAFLCLVAATTNIPSLAGNRRRPYSTAILSDYLRRRQNASAELGPVDSEYGGFLPTSDRIRATAILHRRGCPALGADGALQTHRPRTHLTPPRACLVR